MIDAIVSAAAIPVEYGGEVRKIAIEVKILSVGPSTNPTVHQVTLKDLFQTTVSVTFRQMTRVRHTDEDIHTLVRIMIMLRKVLSKWYEY